MKSIIPSEISVPEVQRLLQGGIGPRPIALVSTISKNGANNLTPFSFFNVFGANPPVIAFSPSRRGRDGSFKDTYLNLIENNECVVNSVTYSMVEQISLASTEYEYGIDEFVKTGLTPIDSDLVKPKRVKESPFQMECRLLEMRSFGEGGASANIAICEVVKFHVAEDLFVNGIIHPDKIDLVARMSADFYCRASGDAIFEVEKPLKKKGIGYDQLPEFMKQSFVFSANNLGKFSNVERIPDDEEVKEFITQIKSETLTDYEISEEAFNRYQRLGNYKYMLRCALDLNLSRQQKKYFLELTAKMALEKNNTDFAWKTVLYSNQIK
ncbi:MAG: flavin reductase family protein [Ignavibacterium album]|jgi:flavin reductase (DIM6/NTAB) family NADH-FMN oxidoreductase RutF|uniref:flavin reductase family protein n=1 Tax=Ignavibacterium album TaxID=591197 RepID=UPI0026EACD66|nr:flavin reductase family protein [Ignavibacterium album]MCX8106592.1 flavin reductase family protein [Ignavibacterium album]